MQVDSDNDQSKDADADGEFVEDDASPHEHPVTSTVAQLSLSHHITDSVSIIPSRNSGCDLMIYCIWFITQDVDDSVCILTYVT